MFSKDFALLKVFQSQFLLLNFLLTMKKTIIFLFVILLSSVSFSQLKTTVKCPEINVDLLYGIVNGTILPTSNPALIKHDLPCYTGFEDKGTSSKCAGVFYKDKDIYFYTERNYVGFAE